MLEAKDSTFLNIHYIKLVSIGSVNPNHPLSEEEQHQQVKFLNKCLNEYPKGIIIGKNITVGRYQVGQHQLYMEKTTYHIGFERKPSWEK